MKSAKLQAWAGALILLLGVDCAALAGGGPLGIDRPVNLDTSGIWARRYQFALRDALAVGAIGFALYEGSESRIGKTSWQAFDSIVVSSVAAETAKIAFSRSRPSQTDDPNRFFKGRNHRSFPSSEVAHVAAALTPFTLEYGPERKWLYAVEGGLLLYDGIARMKSKGHWATDVLAGAALGAGVGYVMHQRETPLLLAPIGDGVFVGLRKRF